MAAVLLHKSNYVDSTTLAILTLDLCILGMTSIGGQYVLAWGENPFVLSTIFTGITSLFLTIILTPQLGITGLPLATLAAGIFFNYRKCGLEALRLTQFLTLSKKLS